MKCKQCSQEAVWRDLGRDVGKYWYCTSCKKEESEWKAPALIDITPVNHIDALKRRVEGQPVAKDSNNGCAVGKWLVGPGWQLGVAPAGKVVFVPDPYLITCNVIDLTRRVESLIGYCPVAIIGPTSVTYDYTVYDSMLAALTPAAYVHPTPPLSKDELDLKVWFDHRGWDIFFPVHKGTIELKDKGYSTCMTSTQLLNEIHAVTGVYPSYVCYSSNGFELSWITGHSLLKALRNAP